MNQDSATVIRFPGPRDRRPSRERLLEAMLVTSGEIGYENVAVRHVIERGNVSRATFYKYFDDREDCFAQAFSGAADWLYDELATAADEAPTWRAGMRAALTGLLDFCATQPAISKALLVEVHVAGDRSMAKRREVMERIARAIDRARPEVAAPRLAPPPVTADFIVGAIDSMLVGRLMEGETERVPEMLPDLLYFIVMQYFGEEAAREELSATPLPVRHAAPPEPRRARGG